MRIFVVVSMIQFKHVVREKQEVICKLTKKLFIKHIRAEEYYFYYFTFLLLAQEFDVLLTQNGIVLC